MNNWRHTLFEDLFLRIWSLANGRKIILTGGRRLLFFFWRDNKGHEIDLIIDKGNVRIPVEIKAGKTITSDYFKGINYWNEISGNKKGYVVYAGEQLQKRSSGITVVPWNEISDLDLT